VIIENESAIFGNEIGAISTKHPFGILKILLGTTSGPNTN